MLIAAVAVFPAESVAVTVTVYVPAVADDDAVTAYTITVLSCVAYAVVAGATVTPEGRVPSVHVTAPILPSAVNDTSAEVPPRVTVAEREAGVTVRADESAVTVMRISAVAVRLAESVAVTVTVYVPAVAAVDAVTV